FDFFFSSRRRHTRWPRDWSSDVCSSDLVSLKRPPPLGARGAQPGPGDGHPKRRVRNRIERSVEDLGCDEGRGHGGYGCRKEREPAHDDRVPVLPAAAGRARLRDQRLRHDGGAGTGRITGGPLRGGGQQIRNGPQGTPGPDGCPRGVGDRALRAGGYGEAAAHLSEAVSQDPKRQDAQLYLGLSYLERGDEGAAAEHLRTFSGLTHSARVTRQVDDALQLMDTEHPLSPQ